MLLSLLGTSMTISTVTSESLQLKLRQLLPSQQGFGTDLSASNTIIPVIDLTRAAEGSDVSLSLQTALNLGGINSFAAQNSTVDIVTQAGFHRIFGVLSLTGQSGTYIQGSFSITDGVSTKLLVAAQVRAGTQALNYPFDFIVFTNAGETVKAISDNVNVYNAGNARQVADSNGELVQPVGFTPQ